MQMSLGVQDGCVLTFHLLCMQDVRLGLSVLVHHDVAETQSCVGKGHKVTGDIVQRRVFINAVNTGLVIRCCLWVYMTMIAIIISNQHIRQEITVIETVSPPEAFGGFVKIPGFRICQPTQKAKQNLLCMISLANCGPKSADCGRCALDIVLVKILQKLHNQQPCCLVVLKCRIHDRIIKAQIVTPASLVVGQPEQKAPQIDVPGLLRIEHSVPSVLLHDRCFHCTTSPASRASHPHSFYNRQSMYFCRESSPEKRMHLLQNPGYASIMVNV